MATDFPVSQIIRQLEVGLKYNARRVHLAVYPFWSKQANVLTYQSFFDQTVTPYSPTPFPYSITTYGVEFDGDVSLTSALHLTAALTFQEPKASDFTLWVHNNVTKLRSDDTTTTVPGGEAENNPKIISRTTLTYAPSHRSSIFLTWSYLGRRAANKYNAWYMPGFHSLDLGGTWNITNGFQLQANVNNLLNKAGVMGWARCCGILAPDPESLTRAQVAANPNQEFLMLTSPPRAFYLTARQKF